ncbi:MAG TPA: 50S ribosomal protein L11 methyltransferase [Streptosporangiaceae bacterium]|nr:50S ribosomal protein L11 methyltransferase [Streptosporangiaceae bacterium]
MSNSTLDHPAVDHAAFIRAHTTIGTVPAVPEIRLHLSEDAIGLWEQTETEAGESDRQPPFWGFAWAGGQALARYVLDHPQTVAGLRVIDLGSGSGLTAIAAALAGASAVLASELDPFAFAAIGLNAAVNGVSVDITGDLLDLPVGNVDVVLAGDIWYEKELAARALAYCQRAAAFGATVLVGDIGRKFLPRELMLELAAYDVPVIADLESTAMKKALVLALA